MQQRLKATENASSVSRSISSWLQTNTGAAHPIHHYEKPRIPYRVRWWLQLGAIAGALPAVAALYLPAALDWSQLKDVPVDS